jgi:hypothetical protein
VQLVKTDDGAPAYGDLNHDGVNDAATVIDATSGAGGMDQTVELYTDGDQRFAQFDPAAVSGSYHADVMALTVRHEEVLIDWEGVADGNGPLTFWSAHLSWDGSSLIVRDLARHTGAASAGLWSDLRLVITPDSLGAVRLGMSLKQAQNAAGLYMQPVGDGLIGAYGLPSNFQYVWLTGWPVRCLGVTLRSAPSPQELVTTTGFVLGQSVARLRRLYGTELHYAKGPPSPSGMTPAAGYLLASGGGDELFFIPGRTGSTITEIQAGHNLGPNVCP